MFVAYWQGFTASGEGPDDSPRLEDTPATVNVIALAFAVPQTDSSIGTDFLCKENAKADIIAGISVVRARGQKVLLSVNGNPNIRWESIDPVAFTTSLKALTAEWGLDGVDLDNEDPLETPGPGFIKLIRTIRSVMGPDFIISYPAFVPYRDSFLTEVKDVIDYVFTMAYWNGYNAQISLFESYAAYVGAEKVCIGVKPGGVDPADQSTPFAAVAPLARWQPSGGHKAGMMLYSLSIDIPKYTAKPKGTWTETIAESLAAIPAWVTPKVKRASSVAAAPAPSQLFYAYWLGYVPAGTAPLMRPALKDVPAGIDVVALAFAVPATDSTVDTSFLLRDTTEAELIEGIDTLRARGQKVILSVNGNNAISWNAIDPKAFTASLQGIVDKWHLDGIDLDSETPGDIPAAGFVALVKGIRQAMGPSFFMSYPGFMAFRDGWLTQVKDDLDLVCTMAYWNDYGGQVSLFESYAAFVGPEKVAIGVKCGAMSDQSTPFEAVTPLCQFQPQDGKKAGMMFWNLSSDVPGCSGMPAGTWVSTIQAGLGRSTKP